jgi:uncharacterized protein (TIGR02145 family)
MKNLLYILFFVLFILSCGTDNKPTYKITTTVSPIEGGTITLNHPGGVYSEGETVTITATPSNGWRFVRWEGDWSGQTNPSTLTLTKDYSIIGIFEKKDYPLTVNIQGSGEVQERVIPQKTTQYPYQTVVELTPIPVNGWRFVDWSGDLTGSEAPKQITVDKEKTVTAKFERKNYPLTITIVGEGTVKETVLPQKTTEYPFESVVILEPLPANGWEFVQWGGDLSGSENPQMIVVDDEKSVTATFQLKTYQVRTFIDGSGIITVVPQQEVYQHGSTITLTPTPSEGWEFVEWSGDSSGSTVPLEVTVTNELHIVGVFGRKDYPLTVNVVGEGSVEERIVPQRTTEYPFETVVELTPIPSEGWEFIEWSGDVSGSEVPQIIVVNDAKNVTATFQLKTYPVSVTVQGSGTITVDPQQELYAHFSTITLTPNPAEGWEFVRWNGDVEGATYPLIVTITNELNIKGIFGRKDYPLTVNILGEGSVLERIIPQRTTQYPFETLVELTSRPVDGWVFYRWTGDLTGNENPKNIQVTNPKSVTSEFKTIDELLTLNIVGEGTVQIQQESFANNPSRRRLTLTPAPTQGWLFVEWTGAITGTQIPSLIVLDANKVVTATFRQPDPPTVSTGSISNITTNSATVAGNVTSQGSSTVTLRGICYATTQNPTTSNNCVNSGTGTGSFSANLTGLNENTRYYVRAFATSNVGTSYGNQVEFSTSGVSTIATVSIDLINQISNGSFRVRVLVPDDGNSLVTSRGFCHSLNPNPDLSSTCQSQGSGTGSFELIITGLMPTTKYYTRGYAINSEGISYSNQVEVTTSDGRDKNTQIVEVINTNTGRTWMDRNLGASRAATSLNDTNAYGDLYQWGRGNDGHNLRTSFTSSRLSDTDYPGSVGFIRVSEFPNDWRNQQNPNLWQGVNGTNNPCPVGFRLPTENEWRDEMNSWSVQGPLGAFQSVLKLPLAGARSRVLGGLSFTGSSGYYWSSTASSVQSRNLVFYTEVQGISNDDRAWGMSVRCIKN